MQDLIHEMSSDVKEIRKSLIELLQSHSALTQVVTNYKERVSDLETRIRPLEADMSFIRKLTAVLTTGSVLTLIVSAVKSLRL